MELAGSPLRKAPKARPHLLVGLQTSSWVAGQGSCCSALLGQRASGSPWEAVPVDRV